MVPWRRMDGDPTPWARTVTARQPRRARAATYAGRKNGPGRCHAEGRRGCPAAPAPRHDRGVYQGRSANADRRGVVLARGDHMTLLATMVVRVDEYLSVRRALGYALTIEGQELLRFARFADREGYQGPVTTALALRWATLPQDCDRRYWARRLDIVAEASSTMLAIGSRPRKNSIQAEVSISIIGGSSSDPDRT